MADHSAVMAALQATLDGDATLRDLVPDGAFLNVAPTGVQLAVIVSLVIHQPTYQFGGVDRERFLFLVKAVHRSTSVDTVNAAAARIHTLLHDTALTITGYGHMLTLLDEYISYTEADDDTDERWQHAGGRYAIWAAPN